jgi:hypothetical protein
MQGWLANVPFIAAAFTTSPIYTAFGAITSHCASPPTRHLQKIATILKMVRNWQLC